MKHIHHNHQNKHLRRVEDIHEDLMTNQISIESLRELHDPKRTPDEDESADQVQHPEQTFPAPRPRHFPRGIHIRIGRLQTRESNVEDTGDENKNTEEEKLNTKTGR